MDLPAGYVGVKGGDPPLSGAQRQRMCGNAIVVPLLAWVFRSINAQEATKDRRDPPLVP